MFIRLLTILLLAVQPLSLAAVSVDSDCGPSVGTMVMDAHGGCCCGDMAASCGMNEAMSCGCLVNSNQNTPAPATPRNQTSQVIAPAAILAAAITIKSVTACHPALTSRSIGYFRSNTHKQATLCVWLS
ncbi:MAG: hypothetical protein IH984_07885 [Planctomycetes bacterium]|nr:hypothetical protein [Planctomycetota bacterium]